MFGEEHATAEGLAYAPFHEYTMKQAIEEKFILDVVRNYTPYQSYYEVVKKVEDDPQFDKDKAPKRIRAYVERQPETIEAKSRIIVDHFCTKVFKDHSTPRCPALKLPIRGLSPLPILADLDTQLIIAEMQSYAPHAHEMKSRIIGLMAVIRKFAAALRK